VQPADSAPGEDAYRGIQSRPIGVMHAADGTLCSGMVRYAGVCEYAERIVQIYDEAA
jgi:hypothetical protein